jgi:iron complex transport system permease protein
VPPQRARNAFLFFSSLVIALLVSVSGTIGFVGLVVPHFCRLVLKPANSRLLIFLNFVVGAFFLSIADMLSRFLIPPFEFPVGVVTTVLGGPLFLFVLWRNK